MLNVKHEWVPDTKAIREKARSEAMQTLSALKSTSSPPVEPSPQPTDETGVDAQVAKLESLLAKLFQ